MDTQIQNMGTDGREVREIVPLGVIGAIIGALLRALPVMRLYIAG